MSGYVIVNIDTGWYYAANSGLTGVTYTQFLAKAARFHTLQQAQKQCCGNERAYPMDHFLSPYQVN